MSSKEIPASTHHLWGESICFVLGFIFMCHGWHVLGTHDRGNWWEVHWSVITLIPPVRYLSAPSHGNKRSLTCQNRESPGVSYGTWQQDIGTVDPLVLWGGAHVPPMFSLKVQLDLSWALSCVCQAIFDWYLWCDRVYYPIGGGHWSQSDINMNARTQSIPAKHWNVIIVIYFTC